MLKKLSKNKFAVNEIGPLSLPSVRQQGRILKTQKK